MNIFSYRGGLPQFPSPLNRKGRYVEVQNGMHYADEPGVWRDSKELVEAHRDGAAAIHGPFKVIFAD